MKKKVNQSGQVRFLIILGILLAINFSLFYWPGFPGNLSMLSGDMPLSRIPDVHLRYKPDEIYDFLTRIGSDGREAFRLMHLTVDLSFPFIYTLFFFLLIKFLLLRSDRSDKWLPIIPVLAGFFDLSENLILNYLTGQYPTYYPNLTAFVELITIIKFTLIITSILIAVYLGLTSIRMQSKKL